MNRQVLPMTNVYVLFLQMYVDSFEYTKIQAVQDTNVQGCMQNITIFE